MISQTARILRLRWLAVLLLSLMWATMGSGAAVAERGDFDRCALAAKTTAPAAEQFYIQNGVRRSVATREAGLTEVPATVYRPGQPPQTTTIPLDRLHSPKPEIPLDPRYQRIQPPVHTPIEVKPLGLPGQLPTTPLPQVPLTGG
jgi:hypothetical protein